MVPNRFPLHRSRSTSAALAALAALLLATAAQAAPARTKVLPRIGDHELCDEAPGLAGWLVDSGELWSLDRVLERGADGRKVRAVVLSFFATWCEPCKEGLPVLQQVAEKVRGDGVAVVLVAVPAFDPENPVGRFLAELGVKLPTVKDKFGSLWERWSRRKAKPKATTSLPRTVIVAADRRLVAVYGEEGPDFAAVLQKRLEKLSAACP